VKFKIDENLPAEAAGILRGAGFIADTVGDENLSGADDATVASTSRSRDRILVSLDLDFANIRAYPPGEHAGIIVLRVKRQDKTTVLAYVRRLAAALGRRNPTGELRVVDGNRIRFRQGR
jgi:predicted nuclease of predicted toxin-antitoxin system